MITTKTDNKRPDPIASSLGEIDRGTQDNPFGLDHLFDAFIGQVIFYGATLILILKAFVAGLKRGRATRTI